MTGQRVQLLCAAVCGPGVGNQVTSLLSRGFRVGGRGVGPISGPNQPAVRGWSCELLPVHSKMYRTILITNLLSHYPAAESRRFAAEL
jgi:hypothetical protein